MSTSFDSVNKIFSGSLEIKQWTLFKDLYRYKDNKEFKPSYKHILIPLSKPYAFVWFELLFDIHPEYLEGTCRSFIKITGRWEKNIIAFSNTLEELTHSHLKYILLEDRDAGKEYIEEMVIREIVTLYNDKEQRKLLVVPRADINL